MLNDNFADDEVHHFFLLLTVSFFVDVFSHLNLYAVTAIFFCSTFQRNFKSQTDCPTFTTTTDDEGLPYADGRWHNIRVIRLGNQGNIIIDSRWTGDVLTRNIQTPSTHKLMWQYFLFSRPSILLLQRALYNSITAFLPLVFTKLLTFHLEITFGPTNIFFCICICFVCCVNCRTTFTYSLIDVYLLYLLSLYLDQRASR